VIKYCKISELCKIYSGNSINEKIKKEKYTNNNGVEYISTKDIGYNLKINYNNGIKIPNSDLEKFRIAPPHTVFICAEGGSAGRKLAISDRQLCFVNKLFAIVSSEKVLPKFIFYFIQSENFNKQFKSAITGLIGGVSLNKFKEFEIPILPILTQQKIVTKLDKIFAEIDRTAVSTVANIKNVEVLFRSYLKKSFEYDNKWKTVKLVSLVEVITKGTTPTSVGYKFINDGINFLKIESIDLNGKFLQDKFAKISEECHEKLKRSKLKEGDILFSIAGALGRTAIVTKNILPANTNQAIAIIRLKDNNLISKEFLNIALKSESILKQTSLMKGGVAQQNLSLSQLKNFLIPLPSISTQQKLATKLDFVSAKIVNIIKLYNGIGVEFALLKQSILKKAFSGELVKAA
jgi:restriction endonuclease S subunit